MISQISRTGFSYFWGIAYSDDETHIRRAVSFITTAASAASNLPRRRPSEAGRNKVPLFNLFPMVSYIVVLVDHPHFGVVTHPLRHELPLDCDKCCIQNYTASQSNATSGSNPPSSRCFQTGMRLVILFFSSCPLSATHTNVAPTDGSYGVHFAQKIKVVVFFRK